MITKEELLKRRRQRLYEELSVWNPSIKGKENMDFDSVIINNFIETVTEDIIKSKVLSKRPILLKYHPRMIDWLKNVQFVVYYFENDNFSGHTSIANTSLEDGKISGKIVINTQYHKDYTKDLISRIKGLVRHELLHLYQYYSWKSFSSEDINLKIREASRYGSDQYDFQKRLFVSGKLLRATENNPIFSKNTSDQEKAAYYINYLGYRLNPLEMPAHIQNLYEEISEKLKDPEITDLRSIIENEIEKELKPIKNALIFLDEFIFFSKYYSEKEKQDLIDFLFDDEVSNNTIMNTLKLNPSQDYLKKLNEIFRKRYKSYKIKLYKLHTLLVDEVNLWKSQKAANECLNIVRFYGNLIGVESLSPEEMKKYFPKLDEALQMKIDKEKRAFIKSEMTLESLIETYKNIYGPKWKEAFCKKGMLNGWEFF